MRSFAGSRSADAKSWSDELASSAMDIVIRKCYEGYGALELMVP